MLARQKDRCSPPKLTPSLLIAAGEAGEPPHVPANADPVRDEPDRAAAEVQRRHRLRHRQHTKIVGDADVHHAHAADEIGAQPVLRQAVRRRHDDIPCDRRHSAAQHEMQVARLKESRCVRQIHFDANDLAQQSGIHTDSDVWLARGTLEIDEGRAAAERHPDKWPNLLLTPNRGRRQSQKTHRQHPAPRRASWTGQRTKIPRNSRAKGETVRSPASRENGLASPELFATRISVRPRRGAVTIIDDDALSATPNCQTIGSPL